MDFLRVLFPGRRELYRPYEEQVFDAVADRLTADERSLFQAQLASITNVQRLLGGVENDLYVMKHSKHVRDPALRLPGRLEQDMLASVKLSLGGDRYSAKVSLFEGFVFILTFSQPPDRIFKGRIYRERMFDAVEVRIAKPRGAEAGQPKLPKAFKNHPVTAGLKAGAGPMTEADDVARLFDTRFPADYMALMTAFGGGAVGELEILSLDRIESLYVEPDNYFAFVRLDTQTLLAVREGVDSAGIYLLSPDNIVDLQTNELLTALDQLAERRES